jgi:hypothetical protein
VTINGTAYNSSQLTSDNIIELRIVGCPIIVVFLILVGFEVGVYEGQNFLVRTYTELDGSLAIYFRTPELLGTKLVIPSFLGTQLDYLAINGQVGRALNSLSAHFHLKRSGRHILEVAMPISPSPTTRTFACFNCHPG